MSTDLPVGESPPVAEPALRVVRGHPSDEELAALVVALAAVSGSSATPASATRPHSAWTDRARLMTNMWLPGPGSWRGSASRR